MLVGCTGGASPDPLADLQWPEDAAAIERALAAEPDPLVRLSRIVALSEAHPGTTEPLCALLDGDGAARCVELNRRPHLQVDPARPAPGPAAAPGLPRRFEAAAAMHAGPTPALVPTCAGAPDPRGCVQDAAAALDATAASAACASLAEARWQAECRFVAAEAPLKAAPAPEDVPALVGRAVSLCAEASPFAAQCLRHVEGHVAERAPPAGVADAAAWKPVVAAADVFSDASARVDPALGPLARDHLWGLVAWRSVDRAEPVAGGAAAVLPAAAVPALRCAIALRLVEEDGLREGSLDAAAAAATAALAATGAGTRESARQYDAHTGPDDGLADAPPDRWRHAWGDAVRPVSDDAQTDLRICLLESAARRGGVTRPWADAAAGSGDAALAWAAGRLGQRPFEIPPGSDRVRPR
ncbi:MAG: hypothetical protein H6742_01770 [Alphaproteobacteria bacterium]|nr:hypothetical protein [Alphaproteobacteria bacterium]